MEQTLGHVTHARNLWPHVCADANLDAVWMPVEFHAQDRWETMPVARSNWTVRASLRARGAVRRAASEGPLDGLFYHTQVTSLFARPLMRRIPTVVSLDATPHNIDTLGDAYDHHPSRAGMVERAKDRAFRRIFAQAAHLVTWCQWAKESLVRDYGVEPGRVTVIPPGVDLDRWHVARAPGMHGDVRFLFVGGDFRRKGGQNLLEAFSRTDPGCSLDIVTRDAVDESSLERVRVHNGVGPNSPEMLALFAQADVFVLPTLGDALPVVCMEAMAAGLPVVATSVGAIAEEVVHEQTGLLVPPGAIDDLAAAMRRLAEDADTRQAMGRAGRQRAERLFSAESNYGALVDLCRQHARAGRLA